MKNLIILSSKTATAASYSHDYAITWFVVEFRWLYRNSSSANAREVTPTRIHRCDTLWLQKGHGARFVYRGNFIGNCVIKLSHLYTIIKLTIFSSWRELYFGIRFGVRKERYHEVSMMT